MITNNDAATFGWDAILEGKKVNCIITDPPFGIDYTSNRSYDTSTRDRSNSLHQPIVNDGSVFIAMQLFEHAIDQLEPYLADECEMYVFTAFNVLDEWLHFLGGFSNRPYLWDFACKTMLVWDKAALGSGDIDGSWVASYELILYLKRGRRDMGTHRSSVLRFDRVPPSQRIHPTEKPVGLLEELIKASTDEGDVVVDPFAGSGSTLLAAKRLNRIGYGLEIDESLYSSALRRLMQSTLF